MDGLRIQSRFNSLNGRFLDEIASPSLQEFEERQPKHLTGRCRTHRITRCRVRQGRRRSGWRRFSISFDYLARIELGDA